MGIRDRFLWGGVIVFLVAAVSIATIVGHGLSVMARFAVGL